MCCGRLKQRLWLLLLMRSDILASESIRLLCHRSLLVIYWMLVHLGKGQNLSILKSCWVQAIVSYCNAFWQRVWVCWASKKTSQVKTKHYQIDTKTSAVNGVCSPVYHMFQQKHWKSQGSQRKTESLLSYLFPMLVNLSFGNPHWPSWHLLPSLPLWSTAFFLPPWRAAPWFEFESSFGIAPPGSLLGAVIWPPGWVDRWGSQAQEMEEEKEDVYIYI